MIAYKDALPCHFSFARCILTSKRLPTGFGQITLRLSDTTENALYQHSTDFTYSLRTYAATKEDSRNKEYLKVHIEPCGHSEVRVNT